MRNFALIGYPISHSGSPELFRRAYGGRMGYELIEERDFESAWKRFTEGEFEGINVTAPYKQEACRRADLRSKECEEIGAANILVKTPQGIAAHNSDYLAVRECLKGRRGKVLVAGWGGAGKAAERAAMDLGLDVTVCNRTARAPHLRPLEELPSLAADCDILVYTLGFPVEGLAQMPAVPTLLEANYASPCLKDKALHYISGREWLMLQAVTGFPVLTGEKPQLRKDIISLTGFMGCGKTSVGKVLAEKTSRKFIDLDEYICGKAGASIPEIFKSRGEAAFRELEAACLKEVLETVDHTVLALGGGAVLNPESAALVSSLTECWYLKASADKLEEWLSEDAGKRPLLQKNSVKALLESRTGIYESVAGHSLDVNNLSYSQSAEIIGIK